MKNTDLMMTRYVFLAGCFSVARELFSEKFIALLSALLSKWTFLLTPRISVACYLSSVIRMPLTI